jgi:hypothetical protein
MYDISRTWNTNAKGTEMTKKTLLLGIMLTVIGWDQQATSGVLQSNHWGPFSSGQFTTGERIAFVINNPSRLNISIRVLGPYFQGIKFTNNFLDIRNVGARIVTLDKKKLGYPRFDKDRDESGDTLSDITSDSDYFAALTGVALDTDEIKYQMNSPGTLHGFCTIENKMARPAVAFISIARDGRSCMVTYKEPGDIEWLDKSGGNKDDATA